MFSIGNKLMNGSVFGLVAMLSSVLCEEYKDTNKDVKFSGVLGSVTDEKSKKKSSEVKKVVECKLKAEPAVKGASVFLLVNDKAGVDGWSEKIKIPDVKDLDTKEKTAKVTTDLSDDKYYCLRCKTAEKGDVYFGNVYHYKDGKLSHMADFGGAEEEKSWFRRNWMITLFGVLAAVILVVIIAAVLMKSG